MIQTRKKTASIFPSFWKPLFSIQTQLNVIEKNGDNKMRMGRKNGWDEKKMRMEKNGKRGISTIEIPTGKGM